MLSCKSMKNNKKMRNELKKMLLMIQFIYCDDTAITKRHLLNTLIYELPCFFNERLPKTMVLTPKSLAGLSRVQPIATIYQSTSLAKFITKTDKPTIRTNAVCCSSNLEGISCCREQK